MTIRSLLFAAVAALSVGSSGAIRGTRKPTYDSLFDAYITPTAAVPASDRVSPDQQFAKIWEIKTNAPATLSEFMIDLPGRVFFSHAGGKLPSDVIARIKVSGKSANLVENVQVNFTNIGSFTSGERMTMQRDVLRRQSGPLLVEIELARRNSLFTLSSRGGSDTVVLDNVLYSSDQDVSFNASSIQAQDTTATLLASDGKIFVSDKTGSVKIPVLSVQANDGNIQLELAAVTTRYMMSTDASGAGNVVMFVDKLASDVRIDLGSRRGTGKVCIADGSNTTNSNFTVDGDAGRASYPGQQNRPFTCAKLAIPERVPVNTERTDTTTSAGTPIAQISVTTYAVTSVVSLLLWAISAL